MKFLTKRKDGGPESTVTGYWLAEIKKLFSVVLLKFEDGSRDAFHSHAFDSLNWVIKGRVEEECLNGKKYEYRPSIIPIFTGRDRFHKVVSDGTTWVFSIRGPWAKTWQEYLPGQGRAVTLTHGRREV